MLATAFSAGRTLTLILFCVWVSAPLRAQSTDALKPDPVKEQMYLPYLTARHGGPEGLSKWKESNTMLYYKELWYFCESFRIRRDFYPEGEPLNPAIIDITRFESHLPAHDFIEQRFNTLAPTRSSRS